MSRLRQRLRPYSQGIGPYLRKTWLHVFTLAIAGFIVHFPALQGQPIWDDDYLVRTNPFIKSPLLVLETFRHSLFPESFATHYRPIQNVVYMADYFLWNNNFYGFHLSSILFHVGAAVLLYFLLRALLQPLLTGCAGKNVASEEGNFPTTASVLAFLVALLWVVHPVHSAAVDYVSGRADSLALFFACGGWLLFLRARKISRPLLRYTLFVSATFSGLLGLFSRESACVVAVLFLVHLFGFEKSMALRHKCIALVICLLMMGTYAGTRSLLCPRSEAPPSSAWNAPMRAVLMFRALGDYGRLMFFPANLHMERSVFDPRTFRKENRQRSIELEYLSIAGLLMIAGLTFGAFTRRPGQPVRVFGAAWFLLAYLPVSNLIELNATIAEHWLYVPSIGLLIFLAGVAYALPLSWRKASVAFAGCAVIALGIRSSIRSSDWLSNEIFARRTIAAGGASIRVALLLGQACVNKQDYPEAERIYRKALQLCPEYPIARNNLADVLIRQGKKEEAETIFAAATEAAHETRRDYPRTWITALNLAGLYHSNHEDAKAFAVLDKAKRDYPDTWPLISFEGELLRQTNKVDESVALISEFVQNNWWHYGANLALGRLYAEKGDVDGAYIALRRASWLDIHETQALNLIAMIRLNQNRLQDAFVAQRRAVSRQPDEPRQYLLLSNILEKMGRTEEARAALAKVSRLRTLADNVAVN